MIQDNPMIQNNYFIVADLDTTVIADKSDKNKLEKPDPADISDFNKAMSQDAKDVKSSENPFSNEQMEQILMMLLKLLTMLIDPQNGKGTDDASKGESPSTSSASSPAKVENNKIVDENIAIGDGEIPKPSQYQQNLTLGDKQIEIGSDGSASAAEVEQTKETLTDLYENSASFKEMLDSSPNDSFEVSVGRRDDNMSWANADGRVFMNINDITPDSNDHFQALTAHEFAHAGINQQHGTEMKEFEQKVALEA